MNTIKLTLKGATEWAWKMQTLLDQHRVDSEVCGSIRRMVPNGIDGIDIVVRQPVYHVFEILERSFGCFGKKAAPDAKQLKFIIDDVVFRFYGADSESWGAMTLFATGDPFFNIELRSEAKAQGYKLNQYGLWLMEDRIAGKTEKQVFDALGFEWVEPKNRNTSNRNKKVLRPIEQTLLKEEE